MTVGLAVIAAVKSISPSDVLVQAIKSVIVISALLAGFRLLGKREMAQLTVYDLAMLFALSNAVQNAMTGGRGNLAVGLATSSSVVLAAWALIRVIIRDPGLETRLIGSPTIIVNDGQVLRARLQREKVTPDELDAAMRAYGVDDVRDVALAVLEVDGAITVVPRSSGQPGASGPPGPSGPTAPLGSGAGDQGSSESSDS